MKMRYLTACLSACLFSGVAYADDAKPAGDAAPTGDAPTDAGTDAKPAGEAAAPAPAAAPASRYPMSIIDRPLTFPGGIGQVGVDLVNLTSSFFDPAFIRVLAGYGINDDFEINFGAYAFPTSDVGKGSIDVGLGYKLARGAAGGKLEVIARAQGGYSLLNEGLNPLLLGVHAQYNVTPKIALITGAPGTGHISIALDGDVKPINFLLPFSIGFQAAKNVYFQLDTQLAQIKIADSANAFIFADSTPLALTGTITPVKNIDVFAGISLNVTPPDPIEVGDTIAILVGGRFYFGKI
jgi:hypothetical protein